MNKRFVHRLMSITLDDFYRRLPSALEPNRYELSERQIVISAENGQIQINLAIKPDHVCGALSLPVLAVDIDFADIPDELKQVFLSKFDRTYQRGGG